MIHIKLPVFFLLFLCLFMTPIAGFNSSAPSDPVSLEYRSTSYSENLYQDLNTPELGYEVFQMALKGYFAMRKDSLLKNVQTLSIIDFRKSSKEKRLFVIDMNEHKMLFKSYVAHGLNSGDQFAKHFSNVPKSNQSSLGFFVTNETYMGKHGLSLRLDGMEKYINDKARQRAIVIHGANYVSEDFIRRRGRLGRSFGCPALPQKECKKIIETIKNRSCLFAFYPDQKYLSRSRILNQENNKDTSSPERSRDHS